MPLLDHFRPPLYPHRPWESFLSRWANSIADQLNELLPRRYIAEVQVRLGSQVEAEVAEFERAGGAERTSGNANAGGVAIQAWAPPAATMTIPIKFPDDIEVHVRDEGDDARLVAVVELVSPGNKDRPESRSAFAAKSAAYLYRGVGLTTLDVVTSRQFNLHNELIPDFRSRESNQSHGGRNPRFFGDFAISALGSLIVFSARNAMSGIPSTLPVPCLC